eukprot:4299325-Pleurochrysis_carterae.AAC.1
MASVNKLSLLALVLRVGVIGLFSDWPATTTFYANCMLRASPPNQMTGAQLGPRPEFLVRDMEPSPLQAELMECLESSTGFEPHPFSIAHRGACLQFPEHTE